MGARSRTELKRKKANKKPKGKSTKQKTLKAPRKQGKKCQKQTLPEGFLCKPRFWWYTRQAVMIYNLRLMIYTLTCDDIQPCGWWYASRGLGDMHTYVWWYATLRLMRKSLPCAKGGGPLRGGGIGWKRKVSRTVPIHEPTAQFVTKGQFITRSALKL